MPEIQLFDYQHMWQAIKPFAIPVFIWFAFAVVVAILIGSLKEGIIKRVAAAATMLILPISLIYFILVGLGTI